MRNKMAFNLYNKTMHPDMYNQIKPKMQFRQTTYTISEVIELLDIPKSVLIAWAVNGLVPKPSPGDYGPVYTAEQVAEIRKFVEKCESKDK